jgi:hypothetical protein
MGLCLKLLTDGNFQNTYLICICNLLSKFKFPRPPALDYAEMRSRYNYRTKRNLWLAERYTDLFLASDMKFFREKQSCMK